MTHDRHPNFSHSERNLNTDRPSDGDQRSELDRRRPDPEILDIGALIDEELSAEARARVQARLSTNADSQRTHRQLARLSRELKRMPVPVSTISPEDLANRTIAVAQERKQQQHRRWSSWGGTAIAALFVTAVSFSSMLRPEHHTPEIAATPVPTLKANNPIPASPMLEEDVTAIETESPLISRALFVE